MFILSLVAIGAGYLFILVTFFLFEFLGALVYRPQPVQANLNYPDVNVAVVVPARVKQAAKRTRLTKAAGVPALGPLD
jgi:hypothetical protein